VALLVASIGVGFVVRAALGVAFGHSQLVFQLPLARPYLVGGLRITPLDLQLAGIAAVALAVVFAILYLTPIGRQMRAVADDPDLARVSGIRPARVMLAMWALAGAVAGVGGLMLGIKTIVMPDIGWDLLLPAFAAAILGGIGSPVGAVLAGLLLGMTQEISTPFVGFTYKIAISFVVMLIVLLVRPRGLLGRLEGTR
jgi:branched-chain amino acid transport system permease protein